jgi:type I restriction enzyme, S subunit
MKTQSEELNFAPSRLGDLALNASALASGANDSPSPARPEDLELPEEWRWSPVSEIARTFTGGTPSREHPEYFGGSIKWAKSGDLNDGVLRDTEETITDEGLAKSNTKKCPPGTLLVALYGATTGKVALLAIEAAINQAICALVPNAAADSEFLMYALTHRRPALLGERYGGAQPNISQTVLRAFGLPVPPLPEQRAIAGVLRTVQGAKEACERVLAATRQLKQSLLHHLFTYGPVPFPQTDKVPLKETEMGVVPEQWRLTNLGKLCETLDGTIQTGPFGSQLHKADYTDSGVPVVNPTHLLGNRINHADVPLIAKPKAAELSRHRLRTGDILFARRGEIGRHGFVTGAENGWQCGTGCFLVRVNHPEVFNAFLPWYFSRRQVVEWLEANAAGAIMPNLNNTALARLPVLFPELAEQQEIARQLAAVDAKLAALASRRAALAALFTSLLHHLLTARLRLPEFAVVQSSQ